MKPLDIYLTVTILGIIFVCIMTLIPNKEKQIVEQSPIWEYHQVASPSIYLLTTPDGRQYLVNWNGGIELYTPSAK